jgi:hypothetical protein
VAAPSKAASGKLIQKQILELFSPRKRGSSSSGIPDGKGIAPFTSGKDSKPQT